jgi:tRNA (mo5U34)-methyltransferase
MDRQQLHDAVEAIRWYHVIDLPHGIRTPGSFDPNTELPRYGLPESFRGKTVLDVGAWDGWFSFEAERRGAGRVLATDSYSWSGKGGGSKDGFNLARKALGSSVEDLTIDVPELSPETVGKFDVVLFLGVLYHLRDPMAAIERVASVTRDQLIVETLVDLIHLRRPAMAYYPGREENNDPSTWVGPNPAAVVAMLRAAGFGRVAAIAQPSYVGAVAKSTLRRIRKRPGLHMAFHAWRSG